MEQLLSGVLDQVSELEKVCGALQKECSVLRRENKELREKTESYSRRFNIRVFGLNKDVEKDNPTAYTSALLNEVFQGNKRLPCQPDVEIAHRVGLATGKESGPRPMIVRLQRYQAKEAITQIAKNEEVLEYKDMKLKIFPDLTTETATKRAQFNDLRGKLHQAGIKKNGLIHPATLILTFKVEKKLFQDIKKAEDFYNKEIKPSL